MTGRSLFRTIATSGLSLLLLACGGGGGSSDAGTRSGTGSGASSAPNAAPTANAGPDQQMPALIVVTLDGSGSSDVDGAISSYAWTETAGTPVTLSSPATAHPTFTAPGGTATEVLTFQLTVTDNRGATANDSVSVTVTQQGTITGRVDFDDVPFNPGTSGLNYAQTSVAPVRGAVVEAVSTTDRSTILATTSTDDSGNYSLSFAAGSGFFLRVKAQMQQTGTASWNFRVVDNTDGNSLYALDGDDATNDGGIHNLHAASGWGGSSYTGERNAAPFAILDAVYQAFHLVLSADAALQFPPLDVHWSTINHESDDFTPATGAVGTFYRSGGDSNAGIYLLGTENVDTDEYDTHVIVHEWGHYFQDKFSRDDSLGGSHAFGQKLDFRVAFSEGWGNAFSGMATNDAIYRDSGGSAQGSGFSINVESNTTSLKGWFSESSIQSVLYDVFDSNPDGVDTVSLGFGPIYTVMTSEVKTSDAQTGIFTFVTALKARNPAVASDIDAIVNGQGITSATMDEFGSTETHNGGDTANLPVYRNLTINAAAIHVCSSTTNGESNKLGNRRLFRFTVPRNESIQITAQSPVGKDPDLVLHQKGLQTPATSNSSATGKQQLSRTVSAGTLVLEVYDADAVDDDTNTAGNACMDVTVTGP